MVTNGHFLLHETIAVKALFDFLYLSPGVTSLVALFSVT